MWQIAVGRRPDRTDENNSRGVSPLAVPVGVGQLFCRRHVWNGGLWSRWLGRGGGAGDVTRDTRVMTCGNDSPKGTSLPVMEEGGFSAFSSIFPKAEGFAKSGISYLFYKNN